MVVRESGHPPGQTASFIGPVGMMAWRDTRRTIASRHRPAVPAVDPTPAEAGARAVAAPVPAGPGPAVRVPAIRPVVVNELSVLRERRAASRNCGCCRNRHCFDTATRARAEHDDRKTPDSLAHGLLSPPAPGATIANLAGNFGQTFSGCCEPQAGSRAMGIGIRVSASPAAEARCPLRAPSPPPAASRLRETSRPRGA